MKTRTLAAVVVVVAAACGPLVIPPNVCGDAVRDDAIENGLALDFGEWLQRHDDYVVSSSADAGVTWRASARHAGGRLFLKLRPPLTTGAVPRTVVSSGGCPLTETFSYRDDLDGKLHSGALTLTVLDGGQLSSRGFEAQLTGVSFQLFDGGTTTLPDRQLSLSF